MIKRRAKIDLSRGASYEDVAIGRGTRRRAFPVSPDRHRSLPLESPFLGFISILNEAERETLRTGTTGRSRTEPAERVSGRIARRAILFPLEGAVGRSRIACDDPLIAAGKSSRWLSVSRQSSALTSSSTVTRRYCFIASRPVDWAISLHVRLRRYHARDFLPIISPYRSETLAFRHSIGIRRADRASMRYRV